MINLWQGDTSERILSGELVIQCGEWVMCGSSGHPSRFIGTNGHSLNVAHYPNTGGARFASRVAFYKTSQGEKLHGKQAAIVAAENPRFYRRKVMKS